MRTALICACSTTLFASVVEPEHPNDGSHLERYYEVYARYTRLLAESKEDDPYGCPYEVPLEFSLNGKSYKINKMRPFALGSQGELFATNDSSKIMKSAKIIFDGDRPSKLDYQGDMSSRDQAGLAAMAGSGYTPEVYYPSLSSFMPPIQASCYARSIFMDYIKGLSLLDEVLSAPNQRLEETRVVRIAREGAEILRGIHQRGILHGDVHPGNFISQEGGRLILFDFGRSLPYIDERTGSRIPPSGMRAIAYGGLRMNKVYLSVNELRKRPITPNDDLFRFAEILVHLCTGTYWQSASESTDVLDFKRSFDCEANPLISREVCQFYRATREADFHQLPIYEPLI